MVRAGVRHDLGIRMVCVRFLDRPHIVHRDYRIKLAEMETDRTGDFFRLVEMQLDLGAVIGRRRIDAVARRREMGIPPAETYAQHPQLAVTARMVPQMGDQIL